MSRLTPRDWKNPDNLMWKKLSWIKMRDEPFRCAISEALQKLAHYEDLEEQGRLIELPCKVKDTVYCVTIDNEIHSMVVQDIYHALVLKDDKTGELKKGYYRTKEEAEAKLAELKGGKV